MFSQSRECGFLLEIVTRQIHVEHVPLSQLFAHGTHDHYTRDTGESAAPFSSLQSPTQDNVSVFDQSSGGHRALKAGVRSL